MRCFTEQWYHARCRKVTEYDCYFRSIANQLPPFFRDGHSLHDACITGWTFMEPYWGRKDLILELNTHQCLTKVRKLILENCETDEEKTFCKHWWLADEIMLDDKGYTLNLLLIDSKGDLSETSIRFSELTVHW